MHNLKIVFIWNRGATYMNKGSLMRLSLLFSAPRN